MCIIMINFEIIFLFAQLHKLQDWLLYFIIDVSWVQQVSIQKKILYFYQDDACKKKKIFEAMKIFFLIFNSMVKYKIWKAMIIYFFTWVIFEKLQILFFTIKKTTIFYIYVNFCFVEIVKKHKKCMIFIIIYEFYLVLRCKKYNHGAFRSIIKRFHGG